ncbi:MAG: flagellar biosynthesis protein FlhF [Fimbriimonadales bacterium]|nr:flagellar biosynthesis protein FlhF [Fimbriimonadales bacterium]
MQVKTYLAPTKLEALLRMREELGPGAMILSERVVRKGGLFRRQPMVEIVAGLEEPAETTASTQGAGSGRRDAALQGGVEPKGVEQYDPVQGRIRQLEREMQEMRVLVQAMYTHVMGEEAPALPTAVASMADEHPLLRPLLKAGVEPEIARELLRRVPRLPHNAAVDTLQRTLIARIPVGGALPRESRTRQVVALVGPTGVGKTTTIAKLAAIHALDYNREVALLSLDTYRIGAIEQLRTYAGIMNLPLHVAAGVEEAREGLELFRACELVLIDTVGRSQRDEAHLHELHAALAPLNAQVYLVLSATTDAAALEEAFQRFSIFDPEALILTKVDEAVRFGGCINLCVRHPLPLAYFTTGQRVPEDIRVADARWLACKLIEGLAPCSASETNPLASTME